MLNATPQIERASAPTPAPKSEPKTTDSANPTTRELAALINREHELGAGKAAQALQHWRAAGDYLLKAKASVGHGRWLPWVLANCNISARQARRYMELATGWAALSIKSDTVADLTLTGALKLLAKPRSAAARDDASDAAMLPNLEALLNSRAAAFWVCPHSAGVRFLIPSAEHPGYCYVDEVVTGGPEESQGLYVARRPFRYDALKTFYPGTLWLQHSEVADSESFVRRFLPERIPDLVALAPGGQRE